MPALVCPVNAARDCIPSTPVAPTKTFSAVVMAAPAPPAELPEPSDRVLAENGTSAR